MNSVYGYLLVVLAFLCAPRSVFAFGDELQDALAASVTASEADIPVADLELLLKPLTRDELEVEARAWLALLKEKVAQISAAEIDVRRKNARIAESKEATEPNASEEGPEGEARREGQEDTPVPGEHGRESEPSGHAEETSEREPTAADEQRSVVEDKREILESLTELRGQRTALIDRLNTVLAELAIKGGDVEPYEQYVNAVSGITLDVSDTGALWTTITGWMSSPEGGLRWARNLGLFAAVIVLSWILSRMTAGAVRRGLGFAKKTPQLLRDLLVKSASRLVFIIGFIFALQMLEVSVTPLLAALGAAGLVIGLALQGTLSNFASGIMILLYRPFDVGDAVSVAGGISGKVESMNLVSTVLLTWDNQRMVVPNNEIWNNVITNITGNETRRVDLVFGISYGDDLAKVQGVLEKIVKGHPQVLEDPEPTIRVHELADSSVNFIVRPWCKTADYWTVYWDVTRSVKEAFDRDGISIPFPQQDVHMHQVSAQ